MLQGFRVILLATNHSQFTQNLTQYLENFGTDLTYVATSNVNEIGRQLDVFDNRAAVASASQRGRRLQSLVLIDDDFLLLDAAVQHRADTKAQSIIICFTNQTHELRAHEFLQSTEVAQMGLAARIQIVTKPVGPRKLLTALRSSLGNLEEALQSDDEDEGRRSSARRKEPKAEVAAPEAKQAPAAVKSGEAEAEERKLPSDGKAYRSSKSGAKKSRADAAADGSGGLEPAGPVRPPINVLIAEGIFKQRKGASFIVIVVNLLPFDLHR
jgi:hypothetical protein